MVENILPTDTPSTQGVVSKGQTIYFSESSHVAYQIKDDDTGSTHASKYFAHRHTLDPGGGVKRSNYIFFCRVSAELKFTSDILSKQPQFCFDIWKFLGHFFNTKFYHHKWKLLSALLKLKPGVVLLPFRMVSAV